MRKYWGLLVAAVLILSMLGPTALAAGSAAVSISGYTKVQQGKSYTYTISVKITSSMDFIGTIKFSGAFAHDPIYLDYHPSSNSSKTITNKVTFKIPAKATLGSEGAITVTGQGDYLDGSDVKEYSVSKSLTAKVIAPVVSTPKPTAAPTKKPATSPKPSPKPTPTPAATATPEPSEWDAAAQGVGAMQAGGTLGVTVTAGAEMPVSLLSALKDKQGKLTVDMGNCACAIDGKALSGVPASGSINLALTTEKDAALTQACGGADLYQLHFASGGPLPGRFVYTFKAAVNQPGDTLYLYYYYEPSGVLEATQAAVVDSSGNVSFELYHFSSYIVSGSVVDGAAGILVAAQQPVTTAAPESANFEKQLADEQSKAADLENRLREAQENAAQLENKLKGASESSSAILAHAADTLNIPYIVLAGGILAVILLTAVSTMLIFHSGPFRRKRPGRHQVAKPGAAEPK